MIEETKDITKKVFRKQVSLLAEDMDILEFFDLKRGMDASSVIRFALRSLYESHAKGASISGYIPKEVLPSVNLDTGNIEE